MTTLWQSLRAAWLGYANLPKQTKTKKGVRKKLSNIVQPSERARQTFARIKEERQKQGKFIKLQPGEKKVLQLI
jgi:hypothetical protein